MKYLWNLEIRFFRRMYSVDQLQFEFLFGERVQMNQIEDIAVMKLLSFSSAVSVIKVIV